MPLDRDPAVREPLREPWIDALRPYFSPDAITRRNFLAGGSAALLLAAYAGTHARHELEVTHRTLAIRNLPDAFTGFKIVQISDIHLEEFTEPYFLEDVVHRTNALAPDLVMLTGDFISRGPRDISFAWRTAGLCGEILSGLKAPLRFACLGNQEIEVGPERVIDAIAPHGTPFLVNQHVALDRGGDRLWLAAVHDASTYYPDLFATVPADPRAPVLLMCHEPDYVDAVRLHPRFPLVDAMFSGHTHGGQIRLPFLGPMALPPMGKRYVEGRFQFGHLQLYVNRGIGTVGLPFRLNCPPELTQFTLART